MLTVVGSQLRHRLARTLALLLGVLVATAAFTVLTGTAETARAVVVGDVQQNFRPAYDILVRPKGQRGEIERSQGLVRDSYLSGQHGGITQAQYERIAATHGVAIAAPVAILGFTLRTVRIPVDLTRYVRPAGRQVLRLSVSRVADGGLTEVPGERDIFVYVTDGKLQPPPSVPPTTYGPTERIDGRDVLLCPYSSDEELVTRSEGPFHEWRRSEEYCLSRTGSGFSRGSPQPDVPRLTVSIPWSVPYLIAAIDPSAEAALVGLDRATTSGRYFRPGETTSAEQMISGRSIRSRVLPALIANRTYAAGIDHVAIADLGATGVDVMTSQDAPDRQRRALRQAPGRPLGTLDVTTEQAVGLLRGRLAEQHGSSALIASVWIAAPPALTATGSRSLKVAAAQVDRSAWDFPDFAESFLPPVETTDTAFRSVRRFDGDATNMVGDSFFKIPSIGVIGEFDPEKVRSGADLSAVPLSLYSPTSLTGADAGSRAALQGRQLTPNGSLVGYAQEPPMLLTTIDALRESQIGTAYPGMGPAAATPIGSVRVRVEGAVGIDAVSRERVRLVAERLTALGLDVDIVTGSSPSPVTVELPAGEFGRPDLTLAESWVQKGVGLALIRAADRKSIALFSLILVVCTLFVANAANAAVRERRRELAVLSALGWTRRTIFGAMVTEVAVIGLLAGTMGALLARVVAGLADLQFTWGRALLAVPAAVLLSVLAGLVPATRAAVSQPIDAVRPLVRAGARRRKSFGVTRVSGLALVSMRRSPGRLLAGMLSIAIGVGAVTVLIAITRAFRGSAVGTLLGDAVTLDVRGVDVLAVVVVVLLAGLVASDTLYLGVRERAAEFASLRATGWSEGALRRLIGYEGLLLGVVGSLAGAGLGAWGMSRFTDVSMSSLLGVASLAAAIGVVVALAALVLPLSGLARLPITRLLAEDE